MRVDVLVLVTTCCLLQAAATHKWYTSVPVLPALLASSEHIADPLCYNHSRMFLHALDNYTLWAVQMLDASVKVPDGIIDGSVNQLGHFDQCLAVSVDDLQGQYCLVEISFQPVSYIPAQEVDPYTIQFDPRIHVWEKLKKSVDRSKITRSLLHLGLCVPASCTPEQLQVTLEHELKLLGDKEGLIFKTQVTPRLCSTKQESVPWTAGEIVYSCLVIFIILLVAASSFYALKLRNEDHSSAVQRAILCFSVQRSVRGILKVNQQHPALDCLDIYKVFCMAGIVLGHRLLVYSDLVPVSDANQLEQIFRSVAKSPLVNGAIFVDVYFALGGTLLSYHLLSYMQNNKSPNLVIVVVVRFLRLTPLYMVVIFFYATLFYRMGSGPLWESVIGQERERCQNNWWTNLIYINNYVNTDTMCMIQTWYLSVDTQLFIVCLFVVYVIGRRPFWGCAMLATLTLLSILIPIFNYWWKKEDPLFLPYSDYMADVPKAKHFHSVYVRTENRAAPYFIGIFVGMLLVKFRDSKFRMSMIPSLLSFVALHGVLFGSIMASYYLYRPGSLSTPLQAAIYASLSRVAIGLSLGGLLLVATFGSLGFLVDLAQWKVFRILGKLVYGVYMVHFMGQLYNVANLRTSVQTGVFPTLWMLMGDLMFSFALSFVLTVLLESPVRALEKLVFQRDSPPPVKSKQQTTLQSL